jgi:RHS repeat-associated protein
LPYSIPVIESPSQGEGIFYRWLENDEIVENSNSINLSIPKGKETGIYTYIHQVKCNDCTEWLSSNPFTVEIYAANAVSLRNFAEPFSVRFSPQKDLYGYKDGLIDLINNAQQKIDISIYSINDDDVRHALEKAVARGVAIRMLYEGALEDHKQNGNTLSHKIEETGVDIRYVNKTNHHKFIITDNAVLATSSGNWTFDANWINDENTLWITDSELILRYRAEFEHLWNNSREFGQSYTWETANPDSLLNLIADNPDVDAVFTSSNYRTYVSAANGPTFAKEGNRQNAADRIVELIEQSEYSIKIAANHLRSRPISEALIAKKEQNPDIDIKVYLDEQEYITAAYNDYQLANRNSCLASATTPAQIRDCLEKNFYYSYELFLAGIDVRFKTYSYKWDTGTAQLMHHKYAIFDDDIIATGSYNYSYNAETNSMENVLIFNSSATSATVEKYLDNFNEIWNTGRTEGYFEDIFAYLDSGYRYVPVLFPTMSLTHGEVGSLKQAIETACPTVTSNYFKNNGHLYSAYLRNVGFNYNASGNISKISNNQGIPFTVNYTYTDSQKNFSGITFQSGDNLAYSESYHYDNDGNLAQFTNPLFNLNFSYSGNRLSVLNFSQGDYAWSMDSLANGYKINYSTPYDSLFIQTEWNNSDLPVKLTDADNRSFQWIYNDEGYIDTLLSSNRNIYFTYAANQYGILSDGGEGFSLSQPDINHFNATSSGTVAASIAYTLQEQADKKQTLNIALLSNNIAGGTGKTASINYLLDAYGRVIGAGNMIVERVPWLGAIVSIKNANIEESRSYNDWGCLTQQTVMRDSVKLYDAVYLYDGLQRITHLTETVSGVTSRYDYEYTPAGQLTAVYKDSILVEHYLYDAFGNRTNAVGLNGVDYVYQNNSANQLCSFSWVQSGNTKLKEFNYNNSGQLTGVANKTFYGNSPTTTSSKSFSYDEFGNLNSVAWASQTLQHKYDVFDRQIATILNGNVKRKLIYGLDDRPIAELNENDRIINTYVYADGYTPVLMRKGNTDYYFVSDIRGSVRMVVKVSDGNILQQMDYDAFGQVIYDSNPGYTPFGYAGGLYEFRTDLIRFGARDYFPEAGKWTAEDPSGFAAGEVNAYNYVLNDPVNYIDPSGLSQVDIQKQLYEEAVKAAKKLYPKKAGKDPEDHHIRPQYLGGSKKGDTAPLNPAYHQVITNAFRREWGYGKGQPQNKGEVDEIMHRVYSKYPLPPGYNY